jgi:hypothetical protein
MYTAGALRCHLRIAWRSAARIFLATRTIASIKGVILAMPRNVYDVCELQRILLGVISGLSTGADLFASELRNPRSPTGSELR